MSVLEKLTYFLGVGLGSGLSPKAPGTAGSIAVLIFVPLWVLLGTYWSIVVITLAAIIGIPICGKTAQLMGVHDDGRIVWDEFVGQSMAIIPLIFFAQVTLLNVALAFVFFRLFDIWKPWPIRYFDRNVHGGFGIMFDDILAGLMAMFAVWAWLALHIA
ncbi:phosphatidylglycerophosphatase A family protein [Aquirhabdus parva]|uniref:Phosphatidylglycerophosphatase A n=1 Tax=Aquirhabdus parva TaxID=2283318 RepID=A0A345PAW6_9GAMM|nr:phosphatidylglycerophosphatase A [Aquirhabdus parva]AXI04425.1 phosphatidylglycerophosphatase A [Aquirhabdus parva]